MRRWSQLLDRSPAAQFALVVAGHVVLAACSGLFARGGGHPSWNPAAGLVVAAVLVFGPRLLVAAVAGELAVNLTVTGVSGEVGELGVSLTVLDAVLVGGAYGLTGLAARRSGVDPRLTDVASVTRLGACLVVGALAAAAAGSTIGRAAGQLSAGHVDAAVDWFQADLAGMSSLAPLLLLAWAAAGVGVRSAADLGDLDAAVSNAVSRSGQSVIVTTTDGRIRWHNEAAAPFVAPGDDPTLAAIVADGVDRLERMHHHLTTGRPWRGELTFVTTAGSETPMAVVAVPDLDDEGRLRGLTVLARDRTEQQAREAALARDALRDSLTGLASRALLVEQIRRAAARLAAPTGGARHAVLVLDIDGFATINDSLGRDAGDELIQAIGRRLRDAAAPGDTLARLEGDDFALLADGTGGRGPTAIADDLLACLREPFLLSAGTVVATASVGIVRLGGGDDPEEVLRRADVAVYRAKSEGGARSAVYDGRRTRTTARRHRLEVVLRGGATTEPLPLLLQPVVDLRTGALAHVQATVNVVDDESGAVPPAELESIGADAGLLGALTRALARSAAQAAAGWSPAVAVAVDIAAAALVHEDTIEAVADVLRLTRLDPSRLLIGLTEEAYLDHPVEVEATLRGCRELGVRIALRDYGGGVSSLSALQHLPIDVLELDPALLRSMASSPPARAAVGAVLGIAEVLELDVVAAGVDTEEQLDVARSLGCTHGRGARIAPPAPEHELDAWLRAPSRR